MNNFQATATDNISPMMITAEIPNLIAMDERAEAMLRRNGFVVLDTAGTTDISTAYPRHGGSHIYVTSDALLALWAALNRSVQQDMEQNVLASKLREAVVKLASVNVELMRNTTDSVARQSLTRTAIILLTAAKLLEAAIEVPADLKSAVSDEVLRVQEHTLREAYPGDDYTQYTVRGYYTDTPDLSKYFQAVMYLSRHFWPAASSTNDFAYDPLRDAIAMAAVVRATPASRTAIGQINSVRSALFGSPNAVSIEQIIQAQDKLLLPGWTLTQALQEDALAALRRELAGAEYPKVYVHTQLINPMQIFPEQIISLIPDIALPDSVAFQTTIHPAIYDRRLPSGLEVAAALGFEGARHTLSSGTNGAAIIAAVDKASPSYTASETCVGLWYRALATLARSDHRAPTFMQSVAWETKQISTALSSWAHLRHNVILAASHTYATMACAPEPPAAVVEANPAFFDAMALLSEGLQNQLAENGGLSPQSAGYLTEFASGCRAFSKIATAQLEGRLSADQAKRVSQFGAWLEKFPVTTGPVIADVATGEYGEILHVAAGLLRRIVVIPDTDRPVAYYGWTQSYYEVIRDDGQRLTDATWDEMATAEYAVPQRPEWTSKFVAPVDGTEWLAREGLRSAEQLFFDGKDKEAITALRGVVEANLGTDVSTDAQLRIGKYYLENADPEKASQELLKCRSLPGGASYLKAKHLVLSLSNVVAQKIKFDVFMRTQAQEYKTHHVEYIATLSDDDVPNPVRDRCFAEDIGSIECGHVSVVKAPKQAADTFSEDAVVSLATAMLANSQPEDALAILTNCNANGRKTAQSALLKRRAELELSAKQLAPWEPIWTLDMEIKMSFSPRHSEVLAKPVEAGEILVVPYNTQVEGAGIIAIDATTGEERWRLSLGVVTGLVVSASRQIYAATGGEVIGIDPENGTVFFQTAMEEGNLANTAFNPPGNIHLALAANVVVATEADSWLAGFDAISGKRLWRKSWMVCRGRRRRPRPAAVIDETVFVTTSDGIVHALNAKTGDELWERLFESQGQYSEKVGHNNEVKPIDTNPVALLDSHLLVDTGSKIDVLDPATGKTLSVHTHPEVSTINPALSSRSAAFIMKWIDQDAGPWSPLTQFVEILSHQEYFGVQVPAFDDIRLYIASEGTACAIDIATGARLAWYPVEQSRHGCTTLGKDKVYFCGTEGKITAMPRFGQAQNTARSQ